MKAILNNEIIELNVLTGAQIDKIDSSQRTLYGSAWYFNPQGAVIVPGISDKPSPYHKWSGSEWIADTSRKQELIAELSAAIDKRTAATLAAGLDFNGSNFPLIGDAYTDNMMAATAYIIGQGNGGRELLTSNGSYVQVTDIAALVSGGNAFVTALKKAAIDEKAALQAKTTAELIELLNT